MYLRALTGTWLPPSCTNAASWAASGCEFPERYEGNGVVCQRPSSPHPPLRVGTSFCQGSLPQPCFATWVMGGGTDLIIPPSSEHLSLQAALTSDTHPSTLQLFSRSSFPPELSSFYCSLLCPQLKRALGLNIPAPASPVPPKLLREIQQNLFR